MSAKQLVPADQFFKFLYFKLASMSLIYGDKCELRTFTIRSSEVKKTCLSALSACKRTQELIQRSTVVFAFSNPNSLPSTPPTTSPFAHAWCVRLRATADVDFVLSKVDCTRVGSSFSHIALYNESHLQRRSHSSVQLARPWSGKSSRHWDSARRLDRDTNHDLSRKFHRHVELPNSRSRDGNRRHLAFVSGLIVRWLWWWCWICQDIISK